MLGALRAVAKDISFEVPMMLSILAIIMISSANTAQPLNLQNIVSVQIIPFGLLEPLGLFIFFVSMIARASFPPFDMGESDSELVTGDTTEYGGLRFGLFYMGLFGTIFLGSMLVSVLYLGGGNGPYDSYIGFLWLMIKTVILVVISLTVWLSMPRIRIDKFVNFGWKVLLPLSFLNLVITGIIVLGGIA
ncbi:NADH dehydrogenase subunit H [mine drainage metagenome]|uniref:NADH dehydrogenase subunit H n=1 Tax=mine drainage metagenome TaxID=410659 RepID=T0YZ07_9ZZZZ